MRAHSDRRMKGMNMKKAALAIVLVSMFVGCAWIRGRMLERKKENVTVSSYDIDVTLARPIEEVFEHLAWWENIAKFIPYTDYEPPRKPRIEGPGQYIRGQANVMGVDFPWQAVVAEWVPPRKIRIAFAGELRGSVYIDMEPVEEGTHLDFSAHIFTLPDSLLTGVMNSMMGREELVNAFFEERATSVIRKKIADMEGTDLEDVTLAAEPVYGVFVDAYFMAKETYRVSTDELFGLFSSADSINERLGVFHVEPKEGSPSRFSGIGDEYTVTMGKDTPDPLELDMIIVQFEPPGEARYFLFSGDVSMEWDVIITPTIRGEGSRVNMIFIVDVPGSTTMQTLEFIAYTSNLDMLVQEELTGLAKEMERK